MVAEHGHQKYEEEGHQDQDYKQDDPHNETHDEYDDHLAHHRHGGDQGCRKPEPMFPSPPSFLQS